MHTLSASALLRPALVVACAVAAHTAAQAAHPLITDDTGTQGQRHWQLELNSDQTRLKDQGVRTRNQSTNATLTYGATESLDLAINLPYAHNKAANKPAAQGLGDATVQAKWRFYDANGWSLALKPALTLPSGSESKGLGNGRSTQSLNLLAQYQTGPWTLLANTGATHHDNRHGQRTVLWNASTAALYAINDQWTVAGDIGISRNPDRNGPSAQSYALAGVIYHLGKNLDLDAGYRRSLQSGPKEHTLGLGLTARW